jgi:hypothetical protein
VRTIERNRSAVTVATSVSPEENLIVTLYMLTPLAA